MIEVAIFSFNRADYLRNCVDSVRRNLPGARIRIYDDDSDDPATLAYLGACDAEVVRPGQSAGERHGGLYANMQLALDRAEAPYLLFLQDDTQVVRPVDQGDLDEIDAIFAHNADRAFLCVLFMKEARMHRFRREVSADAEEGLYKTRPDITPRNFERRLAYFDVVLAKVDRLRAKGWKFAGSEPENGQMARRLFEDMPVMKCPFVFFCPEVPFFRNRARTLSARLAERIVGSNVKSFHDMDPDRLGAFRDRPLDEWPIAETWLTPSDPRVRRPFRYKDVGARWWLSTLHKIEMRWFPPR